MTAITAITAVSDTSAVDKITVNYRDYHYDTKSAGFDVIATVSDAQLVAVSDAINTISAAQLCSLKKNEVLYKFTGGDSAAGGNFSEVSDFARFEFVSLTECRSVIFVDVLAPVQGILSGTNERDVVMTNADVITFTDAITAILKDKKYGGVTDFVPREGIRNRIAKEARQPG